jgi:hypothetical protein
MQSLPLSSSLVTMIEIPKYRLGWRVPIAKQLEISLKFAGAQVLATKNPEEIRAVQGILAIFPGARNLAKLLLDYCAEELLEIRETRFGGLTQVSGMVAHPHFSSSCRLRYTLSSAHRA